MKNTKQSRIDKIRALAERGVDGEKQNAIDMLKKLVAKDTVEVHSRSNFDGKRWKEEFHIYEKRRRIHDIPLPYYEFATSKKIKRAISKLAFEVVTEITGTIAIYNWAHKITCECDTWDIDPIWKEISRQVYDMLCKMGVPVIHNGGDKAGFGPSDDSMEDGTIDSIFQYQACREYISPNMRAEIKSAIKLPAYNIFVVWVGEDEYWGRITSFDDSTGGFTLTPSNPKYGTKTFTLDSIDAIFRAVPFKGDHFCMIPGKEKEMEAARVRRRIILNAAGLKD
jgi:hypothetical protein